MKTLNIRGSHTRVKKKAGSIKLSSRLWLQRQLNDPYVQKAKLEGYRSRSAYKLQEMNARYKILKKGQLVIDLGCAPGGWCQIAAKLVQASQDRKRVVGIDILPMEPLEGVEFLQMDFLNEEAEQKLLQTLGARPDVVLSDMAAATTGHKKTDHLRTTHLCEEAAHFAVKVLKPEGHFVAKIFQGGTEKAILTLLKKHFKTVQHVKPPASRSASVELYVVAKNFKGFDAARSAAIE